MMTATIFVLLDIRLLAMASGAYFNVRAASSTRCRVAGVIFELGVKALETVACETPASLATSMDVLWPLPVPCLLLDLLLTSESELFINIIHSFHFVCVQAALNIINNIIKPDSVQENGKEIANEYELYWIFSYMGCENVQFIDEIID